MSQKKPPSGGFFLSGRSKWGGVTVMHKGD